MGTLGFEDSDVKRFQLLNRVFRVGLDQTGQYLDIEPGLRHAPLIFKESGFNANKRQWYTREKLQDKLVLDGRKSPSLKREDATRYRSAYHGTFISGPGQFRPCRNREAFGPANE